jgi:hypothetical protein
MANLVPTQATDQLGVVDNPWAQLHCGTGYLRAIQLVATPSTHAQYGTFSTPNSRWLHLRSDGILYFGAARIAYHNDFVHTRDQFLLFMGHEAGTGVSGAYPHVPPAYDTLYSVAVALQAHDVSLTSLDARVTALESGGGSGDCCDIALDEVSDVTLTEPSDGQALIYDEANSMWVNRKLGVTYTEKLILTDDPVPASFTLAHSVLMVDGAPQHISVTVNGVAQLYATDYTVSGSTVTWISTDFSLGLGDVLTFTYTGA